jgi:hypothetical protein
MMRSSDSTNSVAGRLSSLLSDKCDGVAVASRLTANKRGEDENRTSIGTIK